MEGSPDKDIEQILKFIFPTIENGIVKAVSETVKKLLSLLHLKIFSDICS